MYQEAEPPSPQPAGDANPSELRSRPGGVFPGESTEEVEDASGSVPVESSTHADAMGFSEETQRRLTTIHELWALSERVQELADKGLEVPELLDHPLMGRLLAVTDGLIEMADEMLRDS